MTIAAMRAGRRAVVVVMVAIGATGCLALTTPRVELASSADCEESCGQTCCDPGQACEYTTGRCVVLNVECPANTEPCNLACCDSRHYVCGVDPRDRRKWCVPRRDDPMLVER